MTKRWTALAGAGALAAGLLVPLIGAGPAQARPTDCRDDAGYPIAAKWVKRVENRAPVVTQASVLELPPTSGRTETISETVSRTATVNSAVKASVSVKARWALAKLDATVEGSLAKNTSTTNNFSKTIKTKYANGTRRNQTYVLYRGVLRSTGALWVTKCVKGSGTHYVYKNMKVGKVVSYDPASHQGAVRCGAGSQNPVGRLALKRYCS